MTHELHQRWQADAGADHVRCECVSKPVWVGLCHASGSTVMSEQGAQPRRCHAPSPCPPLETDKQRRATVWRPLQAQVVIQQFYGSGANGNQRTLFPLPRTRI
jgi:hypothetical protein